MCLSEVPRAPVSPSLQVHLRKGKKADPSAEAKLGTGGQHAHRARLETGSTSGSIAWWGGSSSEHLDCYPACPTHLEHGREQREQGRCQCQFPPLSKVMAKVTPLSGALCTQAGPWGWGRETHVLFPGVPLSAVRQVRVWETQHRKRLHLLVGEGQPPAIACPRHWAQFAACGTIMPSSGSPGPSSCWLF